MARKLPLLLLGLQLLHFSIHSLASMPCWTDKRPPSRSPWRVCWYTKYTDSQSWELIPLVFGIQLANKAANDSFIYSQHSSIHSVEHMVEELTVTSSFSHPELNTSSHWILTHHHHPIMQEDMKAQLGCRPQATQSTRIRAQILTQVCSPPDVKLPASPAQLLTFPVNQNWLKYVQVGTSQVLPYRKPLPEDLVGSRILLE